MATLIEALKTVVAKNDVPHSWPDRTCAQPLLDLCEALGIDVPSPRILDMGEAQAIRIIRKWWEGRWALWAWDFFGEYCVGEPLLPIRDGLRIADCVEFNTPPGFDPRDDSPTMLGIATEGGQGILTKTGEGMTWIPVEEVELVYALRLP